MADLASGCKPADVRVCGAQIFVWIDRRIVDADFGVKVRSSAAASISDVADSIAAMNVLTGEYRDALHVPVAGGNAVPVIKDDSASVSAHEVGEHHNCVCGSDNLLPDCRPNINSGMEGTFTVKWINAFAESGS